MKKNNPPIVDLGERSHSKASEVYRDVIFNYASETWEGSVPIVYRRTGIEAKTEQEIQDVLENAYIAMDPDRRDLWLKGVVNDWVGSGAEVTKSFFDVLKDNSWKCVGCEFPRNPNWARRIQDLKEMGYTIATHTQKMCAKCHGKKTHLLLLRIPRSDESGYETFSLKLRHRILSKLKNFDSYERRYSPKGLLPDHKFPEIRWDLKTREANPDDMPDDTIIRKFQLLTNQRNQQKREVCRSCFQTEKRGCPYGIKFYYRGDENWPASIPKTGKKAEEGCVGCGWYDLDSWHKRLHFFIEESYRSGNYNMIALEENATYDTQSGSIIMPAETED